MRSRYPATVLMMAVAAAAGWARADTLKVAGAPTFDPATNTGFKDGAVAIAPGQAVNASGVAVGYAGKYASGSSLGTAALRWDATGSAATELGNLGSSGGYTNASANAINSAGTTVGYAIKYDGANFRGSRAVRWDAGTTAATELGNLGTALSGYTESKANALNPSGTAAGYATKYDGNNYLGSRAVRWNAGGILATELDTLGTDSSGSANAVARALNDAGATVGYAVKYSGGANVGMRAVRWNAGGIVATELDNLGTEAGGYAEDVAYAINASGTTVGYARKYVGGADKGNRAVRWDAASAAVTELDSLGVSAGNVTFAIAYSLNAVGTAAGYAQYYVGGVNKGDRAVRWDAGGTAATKLADLGTDAAGNSEARAYSLNSAGTAVGYAAKYVGGSSVGYRAVVWLPDASAIDLNDLGITPVPAGGSWTLTEADAMSDNGWVAGVGAFDPDGADPLPAYTRAWVAQVGLGGNWLNTTNTNNTWGRGDNWSTGTPAIQLDAVFNANAAYTVALDANVSCRNLTVSAGHVTLAPGRHLVSVAQQLTLAGAPGAWTATLDLSDNDLIVASGANVPDQIKQAANLGAWNGTGGITSSSAQAAAGSSTRTALGYATGTEYTAGTGMTLFAGQPFNPTDTLIKYTLAGDAKLDGTVNINDFFALAGHINQLGDWFQGDFNYTGTVNINDFFVMTGNFGSTLPPAFLPPAAAAAPAPEPSSILVLGLASLGLLARRRRRT